MPLEGEEDQFSASTCDMYLFPPSLTGTLFRRGRSTLRGAFHWVLSGAGFPSLLVLFFPVVSPPFSLRSYRKGYLKNDPPGHSTLTRVLRPENDGVRSFQTPEVVSDREHSSLEEEVTGVTFPPLSLTWVNGTCSFPSTGLDGGLIGAFNRGGNLHRGPMMAWVRLRVTSLGGYSPNG